MSTEHSNEVKREVARTAAFLMQYDDRFGVDFEHAWDLVYDISEAYVEKNFGRGYEDRVEWTIDVLKFADQFIED